MTVVEQIITGIFGGGDKKKKAPKTFEQLEQKVKGIFGGN